MKTDGYEIEVQGEYIARSGVLGKDRVIKPYSLTCRLPSMVAALSVVKNKILNRFLTKDYADYVSYRTYHIMSVKPMGEKSKKYMGGLPLAYRDRESLIDFIGDKNLPVDEGLYPDLAKLREAVESAHTDEDNYLKRLDSQREDLELDLEVAALNPGQFENAPSAESLKKLAKAKSKPKAKKLSNKKHAKQAEDRVEGLNQDLIRNGEQTKLEEDDGDLGI